jgi:hypothetical protein
MTEKHPSQDHRALVFLETSGNQAYLFGTNKLKENIGASQLTYLAGAEWAPQAASAVGGSCVLATSGKAIFCVPGREEGAELVRRVTLRALREAPGLSVAGAVVDLTQGAGVGAVKIDSPTGASPAGCGIAILNIGNSPPEQNAVRPASTGMMCGLACVSGAAR